MAVVCKNIKEVRDYFDEAGSDISGMSDDELMDGVRSLPLRMADSLLWKDSRYEVF